MKEIFRYPDGSRICAPGQRRAALTAMDLLLPGAEPLKDELLRRAYSALRGIEWGADVNKHDLITLVVVDAYTGDRLTQYVDPITGDFCLLTYGGVIYGNNVFEMLEADKKIY